jgi:hypothetical protein
MLPPAQRHPRHLEARTTANQFIRAAHDSLDEILARRDHHVEVTRLLLARHAMNGKQTRGLLRRHAPIVAGADVKSPVKKHKHRRPNRERFRSNNGGRLRRMRQNLFRSIHIVSFPRCKATRQKFSCGDLKW